MAHRPRRERQRRAASADDRVRRLLADARHTEPMPAEVVSRLDQVLADLAVRQQDPPGDQQDGQQDGQQDAQPAHVGGVTDLSARRRRRATTLLVAAAAVVAVGVGIDRVVSSAPSGSASSTAGDAVEAPSPATDPSATGPSAAGRGEGAAADQQADTLAPLVRVRPDHFSEDADRARRAARHASNAGASGLSGQSGSSASKDQRKDSASLAGPERSGATCERADWGPGELVGVRYDHAPAVLVLRPPHGDTQVADLFRCGSTDLLRSSTLPRRIAGR